MITVIESNPTIEVNAATKVVTVTSQPTVQVNGPGIQGATGAAGTNGTNGTNGQGVPTGGTANQILTKIDGTNYNTQWSTLSPTTSAISASAIDWSTLGNRGGVYTKTLSANTTFTFSNPTAGQTIVVRLTNTASNYTVTWPPVRWSGASAPTMTTGAKSDIYTFIYDGSNYYGSTVQNLS